MSGICAQCNKPTNRTTQAVYCFPCAHERLKRRQADPERVRGGRYHAARDLAGSIVCVDCSGPIERHSFHGKATRPSLRCGDCAKQNWLYRDFLSGKGLCGYAVQRAKKDGLLAHPSECACVDCGKQAEVYDHRDYNEPLQVDPVCRSCNVMRGHAIPFNPLLVGLLLLGLAESQPA